MTSGRLLARNSFLSLMGQLLPALLALAAIPPLVRGLGVVRFGILTLAWATIGYFGLFELGIGRALTQAVAQRLGSGRRGDLDRVVSTALLLLFMFGLAGGVLLAAVTPWLVEGVLNIPTDLQRETIAAFWVLSAALPFVLVTAGLRGLMEAHQHFGRATLLRVPLVVLTFVGPLAVLPFSRSLVAAVSVLAIGRIIGFVAHLVVGIRSYDSVGRRMNFSSDSVSALLRFGGWTTVSNIVSPIMVYLDRFVIGAVLTVTAVALYVTPYEAVVRLLLIPQSLAAVLFPALAASAASDPARTRTLFEQAIRAVALATFPAVLVAITLANEGLRLWLGASWSGESAVIVQWLALGVFATALAQAPLIALQGAGRPDLVAKLHLGELPLYIVALLLLTRSLGLPGVAIAWTLRTVIDTVALFWLANRTLALPVLPRVGGPFSLLLMLGALGAGAALVTTYSRLVYVAGALIAFGMFAWWKLLTPSERAGLKSWLRAPVTTNPIRIEEPV